MATVMVIDDNYMIRKGLSRKINQIPGEFTVICDAADGVEGLRLILEKRPQIVVTDIRMPGNTGLEMIRNVYEVYHPQTVIISGYTEFEYAKEALKLGVLAYLVKPIEEAELLEAMNKAADHLAREEAGPGYPQPEAERRRTPAEPDRRPVQSEPDRQTARSEAGQPSAQPEPKGSSAQSSAGYHKENGSAEEAGGSGTGPLPSGTGVLPSGSGTLSPGTLSPGALSSGTLSPGNLSPGSGALQDHYVAKTMEYINRHYAENLKVSEIAERLALSESYLSRIFSSKTGFTITDYRICCCIAVAELALEDPGVKIYEISEKVGFADQRYFSRLFRQKTGLTPMEYRERALSGIAGRLKTREDHLIASLCRTLREN